MILKGSQRANATELAIHLMNSLDNDHVEIAEIYGTVASDLYGAFAEFEAVASGTKATKPLYSLSINPPEPLTREQYAQAIAAIEQRLGLTGQPRAVVFHFKRDANGIRREHCHVVWSRIDGKLMRAIHLAHDKRKLMDMACILAEEFGLELPPGLQAWAEKRAHEKEKLEPSRAEKAQEAETGISPEQRRAAVTECYEQSDTAMAFVMALEQAGYVLARGDRRDYVIVDKFGNPHSLSRHIKGHKAKVIRARLSTLPADHLPDVDQAKELMRARRQAEKDQMGGDDGDTRHLEQQCQLARQALARRHEQARAVILLCEQDLLTRQQQESLSLSAAQFSESKGFLFRVRSAVADLIAKTPGLRSVLGPFHKVTFFDPKVRHWLEREALARRHARERLEIARLRRAQALVEKRERAALEKNLQNAARVARALNRKARDDFIAATRQQAVRDGEGSRELDLQVEFNDAAEFVEGLERIGEDKGGPKKGSKRWTEDRKRGPRPRKRQDFEREREKKV